MGPSFVLRLLYALFIVIVVYNPICSGFSSPLKAASRCRIRQRNNEDEGRIRCDSMREETMESSPPRTSQSHEPQSRISTSQSTYVATEPKRAYSWLDRLHQLQDYKETHGDTCVPKRFPSNPSLGNWVIKQRVQYRKFLSNETPCSMTEEKVAILNQIGFCWDGTANALKSRLQDQEDKWWSRLEEFRNLRASNPKKLPASMDRWLTQQRWLMQQRAECAAVDEIKLEALNAIDPNWWMSARELQWEERYQELLAYKKEYGDCCVPINYAKNKKLGTWVSNCRKQYKLRKDGEKSNMTKARIDKLDGIGFIWDRWEHEFEQKVKLGDSF
ncbi:unnamed protein product [Cylindrotheca closterium]|uniref:Helicase-associated domain-containing protein n=1 Tax=Cylindrotheca closterium TaxID=2856 RepID=A0AAD2CDP6_9STRA|nr:unnamed protein product [Cylindrotheca closterium]